MKDETYYIDILGAFISDQKLIELEQNLKSFNLMEVFNISISELAISSFLRWILDPTEDHGLDDYFLRYFLLKCAEGSKDFNLIEIDSLNLNESIIKTEEYFTGKKTDITIRIDNNKFLCVIENKIKSSEGEGQTQTYVNLADEKYPKHKKMFVFLTPRGNEAEAEEFLSLSYHEVKSIINQSLSAKEHILNEEVKVLINQFLHNLEVNILNEGNIRDLCIEIYNRHKEAIDMIISYKTPYMDIIENELNELLDTKMWQFHPTKGGIHIFKTEWLNDFIEFYWDRIPFLKYGIWSFSSKEGKIGFEIVFYLEKTKIPEIRDKFNEILNEKVKDESPEFNRRLKAKKYKVKMFENGYNNDEDLKDVAREMKNLIQKTLNIIEDCVETFKTKYKEEILTWKSKLSGK